MPPQLFLLLFLQLFWIRFRWPRDVLTLPGFPDVSVLFTFALLPSLTASVAGPAVIRLPSLITMRVPLPESGIPLTTIATLSQDIIRYGFAIEAGLVFLPVSVPTVLGILVPPAAPGILPVSARLWRFPVPADSALLISLEVRKGFWSSLAPTAVWVFTEPVSRLLFGLPRHWEAGWRKVSHGCYRYR